VSPVGRGRSIWYLVLLHQLRHRHAELGELLRAGGFADEDPHPCNAEVLHDAATALHHKRFDAPSPWCRHACHESTASEDSPGSRRAQRSRRAGLGLDDFLRRLQRTSGVSTTKTCRTVVSGVMGLGVQHEAVQYKPAREVSRIRGGRRKVPRALTRDEGDRWLAALDADPQAVRKDLQDLTRWMLATGVRIGEALAVSWSEVDLDALGGDRLEADQDQG